MGYATVMRNMAQGRDADIVMVNKNYQKGKRKEQRICKKARERGCLAVRSAGSKTIIDCIIVDHEAKTIQLIQAKTGKTYTDSFKKRLYEEHQYLEGTYSVTFIVD